MKNILKVKKFLIDEIEDGTIKNINPDDIIKIVSHPNYKYIFIFYRQQKK